MSVSRRRIFLVLYIKHTIMFCNHREHGRRSDLALLSEWLEVKEEFGHHKLHKFPDIQGPDICGNCGFLYGHTLSGRLREWCWHCGEETRQARIDGYDCITLSALLGCNEAWTEYYLACALREVYHKEKIF